MVFDFSYTIETHYKRAFIIPKKSDKDGKSVYHCNLCNTELEADLIKSHCSSVRHHLRLSSVSHSQLQNNELAYACACLQPRIDKLGSQKWKWHVEASLYRAFMGEIIVDSSKREIIKAKELILKYEKAEKIAMLELAIWKAMCISTYSDNEVIHGKQKQQSQQHGGHYAWMEWTRRGWKQIKSEKRGCNEIGIVIAGVVPYLVFQTLNYPLSAEVSSRQDMAVQFDSR
jgi:hypothetical protein